MHKSDKIHAHTIMMHSVQALYCHWDCHWDCLRILGSIEEYDNYYSVSSLAAFSCADSIYIDCKEKVDTLVIIQYPIYEDEVFEGIFNGKKICITEYKGIMYLVR